ncbi:hypothetical protein [Coleofasciculus sp. FACHB-SPT9]|uniref:hypothetical protein n=1 Tax=Cyanophyceae TaxID=3028117 RepID=UPI001683F54F|nr:hypothetical protein [Coleofasciculus sp. FACHB-SPT9]MBD1892453.1 hypothetical protein [Coleofasciculus sp. FACHB-SPT9]
MSSIEDNKIIARRWFELINEHKIEEREFGIKKGGADTLKVLSSQVSTRPCLV